MPSVKNEVALVTEATSEIGWAIASSLRDAGYEVYGTGRPDEPRVPHGVHAVTMDLGAPESFAASIAPILERKGRIDVLVHNPDATIHGTLEDVDDQSARALWQTNYFGIVQLNKLVVPVMRANLHGTIILVGSVGTLSAPPLLGHYTASKAALQAMGASLRHEVSDFGIRVATIVSGGFQDQIRARRRGCHASQPYRALARRFEECVLSFRQSAQEPASLGRKVIAICTEPQPPYLHHVGTATQRLPWLKALLWQSVISRVAVMNRSTR